MILFNCWSGSGKGGEMTVEQAVVTRRSNMVALLNIRVPPHDSAGRKQETHDWFHVKLVIQGDNVKLYLDTNQEPSLELGAMLNETERGTLGFFGSEFVFANFRYTTLESATCPHGEDAN